MSKSELARELRLVGEFKAAVAALVRVRHETSGHERVDLFIDCLAGSDLADVSEWLTEIVHSGARR